jgi:putative OPT family oligopeptide transporter
VAEIKEIRPAESTIQTYVADEDTRAEFTVRAVVLGAIFGVIFGAVTVYVGLRAGLTVAASIPIAVLSISILRAFGRSTILENNIVQTTGSAGESVAGGVIFTLPALIFLGFELEYARIFLLALIGGWLGVFFMIPLRRQLIVKEHGNLLYPEGTACADVLIAGDRGGSFASRVFWGLGLGGLYTLFQNENVFAAWPGTWTKSTPKYPGAEARIDATSEYLGVGYIIGPRIAGVIFAGGVVSWLVLMPAIKFFGSGLTSPLYPATVPISEMSSTDMWRAYIRPMGAGAVAAAGLITLLKTMPTIIGALRAGAKDLGKSKAEAASTRRTERDLDMKLALGGAAILAVMMWAFLTFKPVPGAYTGVIANVIAAIFVVVFGFLFVTVSSRIAGLIGTSSNPISGMTIATLMAVCAVFLVLGWTAPAFGALAITIGGVVCVAAANAGNTSQDLKTGFLVGATPKYQQYGLLVGVAVSVFAIGFTLMGMNRALESFKPFPPKPYQLNSLPSGVNVQNPESPNFSRETVRVSPDKGEQYEVQGNKYILLNALGSAELPDGKYLYNPQTGNIEVQWIQGIGSDKAAAPQARLMSTVISGILNRRLPWGLIMLGVFLVIAVELLGIRSLSFAVGAYLSIGTTFAIFTGGMVRLLVDWIAQRKGETVEESDVSPGSLYASGLIAAGGIVGLLGVALKGLENWPWFTAKMAGMGMRTQNFVKFSEEGFLHQNWMTLAMFLVLAASAFYFARKPLETRPKE